MPAKKESTSAAAKTARPRRQRARKETTVTTPATQVELEPVKPAQVFDLVGADGRRVLRGHSRQACADLRQQISSATGEKLKIVEASPFKSDTEA